MDLKGSLIDTRLRIYPSQHFTDFLKTIPDEEHIPTNILKLIGKDYKEKSKEEISLTNVPQLNDNDIENLKLIRKFVQEKTPVTDIVAKPIPKEKEKTFDEKEKLGDTPEKPHDKESKDKKEENDFKDFEVDEAAEKDTNPFLTTSDVDWLYSYLQKKKSNGDDVPYLHTLLEGANIKMPDNKIIKRNPELEARCIKLRAQQEAREYRKMTKTVDNVRMRFPEDSISYQLKQINRQLIAIGQFIISIFAGFLFGFRGVEWMVGNLDFGFRMLLGVMCALVIALAEIYFLAKKLNEELNIPKTVQLGGPPKFADEAEQMYTVPNNLPGKEHQD